jgi:hypothetical protein
LFSTEPLHLLSDASANKKATIKKVSKENFGLGLFLAVVIRKSQEWRLATGTKQ